MLSSTTAFSVFRRGETPLPKIQQQKSIDELHEVISKVPKHLEDFRRWYLSMPHLRCPMDDSFLLAFLRQTKFNQKKARTRLDNFCSFRTSQTDGVPEWFQYQDNDNYLIEKLISSRHILPLGFTDTGMLCILIRYADINLDQFTHDELIATSHIWNDILIMDERVQISGFSLFIDLSGMNISDLQMMQSKKAARFGKKYLEEALPITCLTCVYFNVAKQLKEHLHSISGISNEGTQRRVRILDTIEPAYEMIPSLRELMPQEYSGTNVSLHTVRMRTENIMKSLKNTIPLFDISIDEAKRPQKAQNLMPDYQDSKHIRV